MKPNPVFTQCCIGAVLIGGSFILSQWHRQSFDVQASQEFTTTHSKQIAAATVEQYRSSPFPLSEIVRHYETVRDVDGRSPQTRRIFALGAERITASNNRLTLIQARVQSSANPTEFLSTNINRQESALTEFIGKNEVIPPGSKLAQDYAAMLLELELWLRAEQHFVQQTMVEPLPQNPKSLLY
jgi:hypothetical protein